MLNNRFCVSNWEQFFLLEHQKEFNWLIFLITQKFFLNSYLYNCNMSGLLYLKNLFLKVL